MTPLDSSRRSRVALAGIVVVRWVGESIAAVHFISPGAGGAAAALFSFATLLAILFVLGLRVRSPARRVDDRWAFGMFLSVLVGRLLVSAIGWWGGPEWTVDVLIVAKVWAPFAEGIGWLVLVIGPHVGAKVRTHPRALLCIVVLSLDIGWRAAAAPWLAFSSPVGGLLWALRELAVVGLLLGGLSWAAIPVGVKVVAANFDHAASA